MAKAADEKKKKGDEEEMIEKPREPMFSKTGMIMMIGSNLGVAILMVVVVFALTSGGDEGEMKEESTSSGTYDAVEDNWLKLAGITTPVADVGGKSATVRYTILVRFDGGQTEQADFVATWQTGNNQEILRSISEDVMRKFPLNTVRDESFSRTYESELKKQLNLQIVGAKVAKIKITGLRYD